MCCQQKIGKNGGSVKESKWKFLDCKCKHIQAFVSNGQENTDKSIYRYYKTRFVTATLTARTLDFF